MRGDVGVEVMTIDQGDWDMHTGIGTVERWWIVKDAKGFAARWRRSSRTSAPRRTR